MKQIGWELWKTGKEYVSSKRDGGTQFQLTVAGWERGPGQPDFPIFSTEAKNKKFSMKSSSP